MINGQDRHAENSEDLVVLWQIIPLTLILLPLMVMETWKSHARMVLRRQRTLETIRLFLKTTEASNGLSSTTSGGLAMGSATNSHTVIFVKLKSIKRD